MRSQGGRRKTRSCSKEKGISERGSDPLGGGSKTSMETHALALTVWTMLLTLTRWAQVGWWQSHWSEIKREKDRRNWGHRALAISSKVWLSENQNKGTREERIGYLIVQQVFAPSLSLHERRVFPSPLTLGLGI